MTDDSQRVSPFMDWVQRTALVAMCAFAVLIPFEGVGRYRVTDFTGHHHPADWIALLASPALAAIAWRERRVLYTNKVFLAWLGLQAVKILTAPFTAHPRLELSSVVRYAVSALIVACLAVLSRTAVQRRVLLGSFVIGGAAATIVSLGGYAYTLAQGHPREGIAPFVHAGPHPIFAAYRLSGTFGHSPQHMGDFLVVVLALALRASDWPLLAKRRWAHQALVTGVCLALALTMSFAWVGALVVFTGHWSRSWHRPRARALSAVGVGLALVAATWIMNFALPVAPSALVRGFRPCSEVDPEHQVTYVTREKPPRCWPEFINWPYLAPLTQYLDAKLSALKVIREHTWAGTGEAQYLTALPHPSPPQGPASVRTAYESPHCSYLQAVATSGVFGGLALLLFVWAVAKQRRSADGAAFQAWLGVVALLCIGVNIDVLAKRELWFSLGILCGGRAIKD